MAITGTDVVVIVILGLITATIASRKGHPFVVWWLYGMLIAIVALPQAVFFLRNRNLRRCPHCQEKIRADATICKECHREVTPVPLAER